jgi:serine protease Do
MFMTNNDSTLRDGSGGNLSNHSTFRFAFKRLGFALTAAACLMASAGTATPAFAQSAAPTKEPTAEIEQARSLSKAFRYVAKTAEQSVVHINAMKRVVRRDFFGRIIERSERPVPAGVGSGVILTGEGRILTNNHVIADADAIRVRLHDGREFDAKILGSDQATDLALISIDADGLKAAQLGDSDAIEVGDWVVAVGNPFGFDNTVTAGIVSAKGRALSGSERANEDFIQTDAPINPGNSGGPLFDLEGKVIGINSAIATRSGGSVGLGFAIPSNIARYVADTLGRAGRVERGYLGIDMVALTPEVAAGAGIRPADGIAVRTVVPDSPADRGGLKPGDVLVKFQGRPIDQVYRMRTAIALTPPNTDASIEFIRDGKRETKNLTVGDREQAWKDSLGMQVEQLSAEQANQLGYRGVKGVVVKNLTRGGRAARSGLETNDVVVEIDRQPVDSPESFYRMLNETDDENGARLSVLRGGESGWLVLEP